MFKYYKIFFALAFFTYHVLALDYELFEDEKLLLPYGELKLSIIPKNQSNGDYCHIEKINISGDIIDRYPNSLFHELLTNPPKAKKLNKMFNISDNRIKLKCSKEAFDLAYQFITENRLPEGYFMKTAQNAANFFKLDEILQYVQQNPPTLSGFYSASTYAPCPHCQRPLGGSLNAGMHLTNFHQAKNIIFSNPNGYYLRYQTPSSEFH